jgi:predicted protein tyrosine phosphatase
MIFLKRNLFVCVGNVDRSKAGEMIYSQMLREQGFLVDNFFSIRDADFYVGSAGIQVSAEAEFNGSIQLDWRMVEAANRIFSIDEFITQALVRDFSAKRERIVQLDIQDGRSLIVSEQAKSLFEEFREKLRGYVPERKV